MFEPDHSARRWWNHRFSPGHAFATGLVACLPLGLLSALFLPPGGWTLESTVPSVALGLGVFTAALFVSDTLYHALVRRRGS